MSGYFERNRKAYNDHMLRVSHTGEWRPWLDFFLRGVVESARESAELVTALLELHAGWQGRFHSARSSALLLKLVDDLLRRPSMTIGQAAKLLGVTHAAASANIGKLVQAGILTERTGRKRDQVFVAMDILRIVEDAHRGPAIPGPDAGDARRARTGGLPAR